MELSLPQRQIDSLAGLALRLGKDPSELLAEAVDKLLADEDLFARQVKVGIDQIARGEFIEEEAMDERVRQLMRA
jgi:predicted transcriptional regulator